LRVALTILSTLHFLLSSDIKWEVGENHKLNLSDILHKRDGLSIMTFNVRFDNKNDKENSWDHRKENVL
jgi:hypothetical protein